VPLSSCFQFCNLIVIASFFVSRFVSRTTGRDKKTTGELLAQAKDESMKRNIIVDALQRASTNQVKKIVRQLLNLGELTTVLDQQITAED